MTKLTLRRLSLVALLLPLLSLPAFAGQINRIGTVKTTSTAALTGSAHPMAQAQFDQGAVPETMPLKGLSISFQRSAAQQASLESLIGAQLDPGSPQFHQWLTPEQFATNYGMSADDIAKTTAWLTSQGFTVTKVADSGTSILFTGTAAQASHAFGTEIHYYTVNGVKHYANASVVSLPAALAGVVNGVAGLDDFKPRPHSRRGTAEQVSTGGFSPLFTSGVSGNHYLSPGDFSTIYDVKALTNAGFNGTGVTIGVVGETDVLLSDVAAFRAAASLPANVPTVVVDPALGDPGLQYANLPEADLDMEWSGGIAPNANIVYINSTDAILGALAYGIQNRVTVNSTSVLIPILSVSYGLCEANLPLSERNTIEGFLQQAASQGQTVIVASGDNGAADCDYGSVATYGLAVDYPSSSAYVTSVGGTTFNEGASLGGTTYWNANGSTDVVSSALSYIPEMAWNDTPTASLASQYGGLLGGGGGASSLFSKPAWQTGVSGIPTDGKRDVPDIALSASAVHDPYLVCTQVQLASTGAVTGSCGNGFRISDGSAADNGGLTVYGGTSLGAPSFAGVLALIEQKLGSQQGLINPALYSIASNSTTYASSFHDITTGSNAMPCSGGTGCTGGLVGYSAAAGYDLATGLGSIDANNLATNLGLYNTAHGSKIGSSVSLTAIPTTPVIGQPVTFTATVTPNSGSVPPTGSVTFSVDGVATGSSAVALTAGTASTTYSFASGGSHTVIATYSGDGTYYLSISPTLSLTNFTNAPSSAATTTTLCVIANLSLTTCLTPPYSATLYSSLSPVYLVTVTSTTAGTISGTTVTFTVGSGTGAVTTKKSSTSCSTTQCTFILPATAVTSTFGYSGGAVTVNAHYDGNTSYQQSSATALTVTVANPAFTITVPTMTVAASALAAPATATATVTSTGGFSDLITFSLTTTNYPGCGFISPGSVTPPANGTVTATVTLSACSLTGTSAGGNLRSGIAANGFGADWAGVVLAVLCVAGCFRRRGLPRVAGIAAIVLLGGLMAGLTGCSGGTSTLGSSLPSGTYQVTLTGTDAVNPLVPVVSTTFNVIVQ